MPPSIPQIINHIWFYLLTMINAGHVNNIMLPLSFKGIVGKHGIDLIVARFATTIHAPVDAIEDAINGVIRIFPRAETNGRTSILDAQAAKAAKNPNKVSRPPNAFILYRAAHHPLVKKANPELHNNQISIVLGAQWKNETDATKNQYRAEAESLKRQHAKDHPDYTYQPRKSGQKKRRMTHKKAAVLSEIAGSLQGSASANATSATLATTANATAASATTANATVTATTSAITALAPAVAVSNLGNAGLNNNSLSAGASSPVVNDFGFEDFDNFLPELEINDQGNPMFTLGDVDISDDELFAMLDVYNNGMPLASPADAWPAVIFAERSEEAQNQYNFFNSAIDHTGILARDQATMQSMQASYDADVHEIDAMTAEEREAWYDDKYGYYA